MFCEQCGTQIADGDLFCQECGWKVTVETVAIDLNASAEAEKTENVTDGQQFFSAPDKDELAGTAVSQTAEDPVVQAAPVQTETPVRTEQPVQITTPVQAAAAAANSFWTNENAVPPMVGNSTPVVNKPKKKSKKGWLIALGVVAVIGVLVAVNFARIENFFRKTFSSSEEYYQFVEAKQVETLVDAYMNGYDSYMDMLSMDDKSYSVDMTLELGSELKSLMRVTGVDLSWLESANLAVDTNFKDEVFEIASVIGVNDVDILSGNIIVDYEDENMYMQLPELNELYIGASFEDAGMDVEVFEETFEIFEAYQEFLPESDALEELLTKYITLALEQIDDVEEKDATLEVGDVSQKCTALEITIDTETVQKMAEAVLEEVSKDKDLEDMVKKAMEMSEEMGMADPNMDADDMYDEFLDEVDSALERIDEIDMGDVEILMTVYVNGKGEVIGREIEAEDFKFRYAMPVSGSSFEMECYVETPNYGGSSAAAVRLDEDYYDYEDEADEPEIFRMGIEGKGKLKGNKITGDFTIKDNSMSYVNVKVEGYNIKKAKDGEMVGTFTFTLSKDMKSMLKDSGSMALAGYLNYGLEIDMDTDSDGGTVSFALVNDEEFLVKLTMESDSGKGEKVSIPSSKNVIDAMDEDELEEWVEDIEWDDIIKKLEKADVDDDYIEMFEELIEELIDDMY